MWLLISLLMTMAIILVSADNADMLLEDYFIWKSKVNPEGAYTTGFQAEPTMKNYSLAAIEQSRIDSMEFRNRAAKLLGTQQVKQNWLKLGYIKIIHSETDNFVQNYHLQGFLLPPVHFFFGAQSYLAEFFGSLDDFR
jgi:hypothetical protein